MTREELQQNYAQISAQLGELEYQYAIAKNPLLMKLDELQKQFAEVVAKEQGAEGEKSE